MCDEYRMNGDKFRINSSERIVQNTEIDQQWADWLAPTRRSFLFGAGAAAIGLTLGEEAARAEEAGTIASPARSRSKTDRCWQPD